MTKVNPTSQKHWGLSLGMVSKLISIEKPKVPIMVAHFVNYGFTWITLSHKVFFSAVSSSCPLLWSNFSSSNVSF